MNASQNLQKQIKFNKLSSLFHQSPGALFIGIACYSIWYLLFSLSHPLPFVDERLHQPVIFRIHQNNFDLPGLPMLPGYHWIIAVFSKVSPVSSLALSRFITFLICVAMIVLYTLIPLNKSGHKSKRSPLLLVFLPILFPYTAMVYTDAVALFFIISAIYFHIKRYFILAALCMFFACLIRQTNMLWLVFMIAWCALDVWDQWKKDTVLSGLSWWNTFVRHLLPQVFSYVVAFGFIGAFFLFNGDILASNVPQNSPRFNMGNFYILSFIALILWTPIWLERTQEDVRSIFLSVKLKPFQTGFIFFVLVVTGGMLVIIFDNWHPWNQNPWFLRNIPLKLMEKYIFFRILGVICFFYAIWFVARFWSLQSNRRHLMLLALFIFIFLLPHSLVEPRYLIVPFVLADFFVNYSDTQMTKLTLWYFSINVIGCALIASGLAMW